MADHPCFACALPDCDDTDLRCALRKALNKYYRLRSDADDETRALYKIAYKELHAPQRNATRRKINATR